MESLPLEITEKILSGLSMISQLQCREVWRNSMPKPKKGLLYGVSHCRKEGHIEAEFYFSEQNHDNTVTLTHVGDGDEQLRYVDDGDGKLSHVDDGDEQLSYVDDGDEKLSYVDDGDEEPIYVDDGDEEPIYVYVEDDIDEQLSYVDDGDEQLSCLGTLTKFDHNLIMSPSFDFKDFMIVGSCNGLVCCAGHASSMARERKIYIFNPITGEYTQPPSIKSGNYAYSELAIGFGYNRSSNEYKVIRIMHNHNMHLDGKIQVYTLQGGTKWRNTTTSRVEYFFLAYMSATPGVFAGGSLHWIDRYQCSDTPKTTVAFDLKRETFEFLPSIPSVGGDNKHFSLMELGGNLCVLEVVLPSKQVTIWELDYTNKRPTHIFTWVTKFSITLKDYRWFKPFAQKRNHDKGFLLWYNAVLSSYDPETNTLKKLDETLKKLANKYNCTNSIYTTTQATPHMNSLVSLKAVMKEKVGTKRKARQVRKRKRKTYW